MSLINGILRKPILMSEIARCLGIASYKLSYLCKSGNIREWARYKPVALEVSHELTESERISVGYGLELNPTYRYSLVNPNISKIIADVKAGNYTLYYNKPGKPCKMSDFNCYNHNAINPLEFLKLQEKGFGSVALGQRLDTLPEYNITLADLTSSLGRLTEIGYGVAVHAPDNSYYLLGIDSNDNLVYPPYISDVRQEYNVTVSKNNASGSLMTGIYECVFVTINKNRGEIYTLPMPFVTLSVTAAGYITIALYGLISPRGSGSKSDFSYQIDYQSVNNGSGTIPAGSVAVEIYGSSGQVIQTETINYPALSKKGDSYTGTIILEIPFNDISGGRMWSSKYNVETQIEIDMSGGPID